MALEIERKFLVKDRSFIEMATSVSVIRQAYISHNPVGTVRVRRRDEKAFLTIKGVNSGAVRHEWEYEIPLAEAEEMATLLTGGWSIDKERFIVPFGELTWEIDVFHGNLEGLILAEVELSSPDAPCPIPPFVGQEVTGDPRYYNSVLSRHSSYPSDPKS